MGFYSAAIPSILDVVSSRSILQRVMKPARFGTHESYNYNSSV